ncbi:MAG: hypothetical protein GC185_01980 [Alphaproteobacteria bacterium]|nr:hypothetical protein [Alphaproteobacteria bacterium]
MADAADMVAGNDADLLRDKDMEQQLFFSYGLKGKDAQGVTLGPQQQEKPEFDYGWCKTDHKDGKEIRQDWRQTDYLNDEPYATRVRAMLEQLGLPAPEKEQIFRGTNHDLLFLNTHGVVVRIGPIDVEDLMNPAIVQPLGWLEDKENPVKLGRYSDGHEVPCTVAIYPGIELLRHYLDDESPGKPELVGDLRNFLNATGQGAEDMSTANCGVIRVFDDDGKEIAVKMLLDSDNSFNASSPETREKRATRFQAQESSKTKYGNSTDPAMMGPLVDVNKGEMLMNTLRDVFNAARNAKYFERAFEVHQPLRHMFWDAFKEVEPVTGQPDIKKRQAFWDKCAAVTNKPEPMALPVWCTAQDDADGIRFVREELVVPHLVLYRPWTGLKEDRVTKPIEQTEALKAAIERAHRESFRFEPPVQQQEAKQEPVEEKPAAKQDSGMKQDEGLKRDGLGIGFRGLISIFNDAINRPPGFFKNPLGIDPKDAENFIKRDAAMDMRLFGERLEKEILGKPQNPQGQIPKSQAPKSPGSKR